MIYREKRPSLLCVVFFLFVPYLIRNHLIKHTTKPELRLKLIFNNRKLYHNWTMRKFFSFENCFPANNYFQLLETICMRCQILFSGKKNMKSTINMLSAKTAQRMISINFQQTTFWNIFQWDVKILFSEKKLSAKHQLSADDILKYFSWGQTVKGHQTMVWFTVYPKS